MSLYINITLTLILGFAWILIGILIGRKVRTYDVYIVASRRLGIALSTAALLAFWITGNTMLAAPEAAYTMGFLGALGYALAGGLGILYFVPLALRIKKVLPSGYTIGDFYRKRYDPKNFWLFFTLLLIYAVGGLVTQGIGGGVLLEAVFDIPYHVGLTLTIFISLLSVYLGGLLAVAVLSYIQVLLILITALVAAVGVVQKVGVSEIYTGLGIEHLSLTSAIGLLWCCAGPLIGIGEVFMDNTFWQRVYATDEKKIKASFIFAGLGWMAVPLCVSLFSFVALAKKIVPFHVNAVAPIIAQEFMGPLGGILYLVSVWSAIASTVAAFLNAVSALIVNDIIAKVKPGLSDKQLLHASRLVTLFLGILALLLSLPKILTMLQILIFLGVINGAFIAPIAFGLLKRETNRNAVFVAVILSTIIGYIAYFTIGPFQGIITASWISLLIVWIGSALFPEKTNQLFES